MDISLYYSYTQWIYPMDIWSMYPWYSQWMYRQSPGSPSLQLPRVSHRRCRSPRVSRCPNSSFPQGNSWRFTKFLVSYLYIYIHTYIYITFVDVCFPEEQISNLSNMTYVSLQHFKCFFSGNMKEPGWTFGEWTLKKKPEWNGEADLNGVSHGDNRLFSTAQYNRLVQSSFSQGFLAEIPPLIVIFHGNICME